jgi:thioredoxin 1
MMDKTLKVIIVIVLIAAVALTIIVRRNKSGGERVPAEYQPEQLLGKGLPALVDLGSDQCIPCKMMAPILEELKAGLAGKLQVSFLDVRKHRGLSALYGIQVIPTQIFYDNSGKELFRHEGFFSKEDILSKWKEFGVNLTDTGSQLPAFERLAPAQTDNRPRDTVCYMCDRDINAKTLVMVRTDKGPVRLCGPHCYFIMYSCLTEDKTDFDKKVSFTDSATGVPIAATEAAFLYGQEETTGKPWIKAYTQQAEAVKERASTGGNILGLVLLQQKELSHRCGFCDRACYPQDAAEVIVEGGLRTWGCCSHCALGVAARTGKDIEVHEKDRLSGDEIIVKTIDGKVASLEPKAAVAWFGQRRKSDGTWGSAGCFHQGFFVNAENLKTWVEKNPYETGKLIGIREALAAKMKLSPEQIQKACKIGECAPK